MTRYLFTLLCSLSICACKKEKEPANPISPADTATVHTYDITSTAIVELSNNFSDTTFRINVNKLGEESTSVTLSATSVPQYTHLQLTDSTGIVPFETNAEIRSVFATPGLYTMVIAADAGLKEKKEHKVNLKINPTDDRECADFFYNNCIKNPDAGFIYQIAGGKKLPIKIVQNAATGKLEIISATFWLSGMEGLSYHADSTGIPFNVNCNDRTIVIERTQIIAYDGTRSSLHTFEGEGEINPETKTYNIVCTLTPRAVNNSFTITGKVILD